MLSHLPFAEKDVQALNQALRQKPQTIYMMGIGGIGMAGLAQLLHQSGHQVCGSDCQANQLTDHLITQGLSVFIGHKSRQIPSDTTMAIRSMAIPCSNPEWQELLKREIPVYLRGLALAAFCGTRKTIAVTGTHGKTTTSARTAILARALDKNPGYFIGGEVQNLDDIGHVGTSALFVTEADESDGTLAFYRPQTLIITNIEYDHMEHFSSRKQMEDCFQSALNHARHAIYCADDPVASRLTRSHPSSLSYGTDNQSDLQITHYTDSPQGASFRFHANNDALQQLAGIFSIPVHGLHNVLNTAASCIACAPWINDQRLLRETLARGVHIKRRFQPVGTHNGATIISDYAHHPTEIRALIQMAKPLGFQKIIMVYQPHRFTRTLALKQYFPAAFDGMDELILCPVYAASEPPLPGGTSHDLLDCIHAHNPQRPATLVDHCDDLDPILSDRMQPGTLILLVGAGDIEHVALRLQRKITTVVDRPQKNLHK
ncbi:MAG: UDP-N-acetylmuramate--L-alanine ligase [Spartobacteria bacterium]|nr:UDP-N-acetylmuramate--L-alanine ligase [Spartobacteria bacterium]